MLRRLCLVALVALAGCKPSYDDQIVALDKLLSKAAMGSSRDFWLVKASSFGGPHDRVALVFGFLDDYTFCLEIADLYMKRYPMDRYVCLPAN